ncbi:MAG: VOC family protein [Streptosporangiales bacterium]|nr:VOC family protein [Streptosporangiales bacterium]
MSDPGSGGPGPGGPGSGDPGSGGPGPGGPGSGDPGSGGPGPGGSGLGGPGSGGPGLGGAGLEGSGRGGGAYLEIVGPDPEQGAVSGPRPFGIDRLAAPHLVTWAVAVTDIDAAVAAARARGVDPGDPLPMSRRTPEGELLEWRLTPPPAGPTLLPFLIDWGSTPHPTSRGLPEVELHSLTGYHPHPDTEHPRLAALGADLELHPGDTPELSAVLITDTGPLTLR